MIACVIYDVQLLKPLVFRYISYYCRINVDLIVNSAFDNQNLFGTKIYINKDAVLSKILLHIILPFCVTFMIKNSKRNLMTKNVGLNGNMIYVINDYITIHQFYVNIFLKNLNIMTYFVVNRN